MVLQSASILLRMPQVAAATAQTLFQRYFYVKSFVKNDYEVCDGARKVVPWSLVCST